MTKLKISKLLAAALVCFSAFSAQNAQALIPVADAKSAMNTVKEWFNGIKESKFVIDTTTFISKTSATIGDAKKSATEYVLKNKEKLEKKLEKVKEYKEQAEEYKKEYDEYKKWLDENIAEAERLKALGEAKLAEAQQMKDDIKDGASAVKGMAQDKLGAGGSSSETETADVTDSSGNGSVSSGTTFSPTLADSTYQAPNSSRTEFTSQKKPANTQLLSSSDSAALAGIQNKLEANEPLSYNEQKIVNKAKVQAKIAAGEPLDYNEQVIAGTALAQAKAAAGEELSYHEQALVDTANAEEKAAKGEELTEEEQKLLDVAEAKEKAAKGEELSEEEQKLLDEDKAAEDKAKDEKLSAMSEDELRAKLKEMDEAKKAGLTNEFEYTREELEAKLASKDEQHQAELKAAAEARKQSAKTIQDRLKAADEAKRSSFRRTPVSSLKNKAPTRRSFGRSDKVSALEFPEVRSFAMISNRTGMAFGSILSLPDGGVDKNGAYIVPRAVAKSCKLNSADALEKGAMDACLVGLNDAKDKAQLYEAGSPAQTYLQGKKELAAAYIATAYKAQNDADAFADKILDPIDFASATTTMDVYSNIVEMNQAVTTSMNSILKIYSARLALSTYDNYGKYDFTTPEDEKEENQ